MGLAGVRERLELMGGSLKIESRAGRTIILAEIPGASNCESPGKACCGGIFWMWTFSPAARRLRVGLLPVRRGY